ncbi:MAG: cobalt transporter, ATPase subunit, partial [Firmicutes bacterium]|nr:cobalt transporter, ATPase subunit [Bacillota bacterium]
SGHLLYGSENIQYDRTYLKKLRQRVGLVFQNPDIQLFSASVQQDISFGLLNMGYSQEQTRLKVDAVGRKLGIQDLFKKPTHFLSTGQKKLIALAGVLVMEPELIICDEPTAGLDQSNARILIELMDSLHQNGTSLVISTHDVNLAYSWASHIILLNQGQVLAQGKPAQVLADSNFLTTSSLEKPWILESWESLQKSGRIACDQPPPTTKEEYFSALSGQTDSICLNKKVVTLF